MRMLIDQVTATGKLQGVTTLNLEIIGSYSDIPTHEAAADPHPGYALESSLGTAATQDATAFETAGAVSTHNALTGTSVHGLGTASTMDIEDFAEVKTGLFSGVPLPAVGSGYRIPCYATTGNNATWYKVFEAKPKTAYGNVNFFGVFKHGSSGSRFNYHSTVKLMMGVGDPATTLLSYRYQYRGDYPAYVLRATYEKDTDGYFIFRVYVNLDSWASAVLDGVWTATHPNTDTWIYDDQRLDLLGYPTDPTTGQTNISATKEYEFGADVTATSAAFTGHTEATGTSVHGLGTAAAQNVEAFEPSGAVASHAAAVDPHPVYALESSLGTAATADVTTSTTDTTAGRLLKVGDFGIGQELSINPIIYDSFGDPNVMVRIPKFRVEDIDASLGTGVHPAFIVNGIEKDAIYISKYLASVKGTNYVSLPNVAPANYINFDTALAKCAAKGAGWHLMTNAEWSAVALWSWKNGTIPHGNNSYGRDITYKHETGRLVDPAAILGSSGIALTATGSGPATWNHDHTMSGICDLNGNIYEWSGGVRTFDGEIQVLANNNAADNTKDQSTTSTEWKAILQDGSLVAPGTANTLKYDATNADGSGTTQLDIKIDNRSNGTTSTYTEFEYTRVDAAVTVPPLLKQLGLFPHGTGLGGDSMLSSNLGEAICARSGYWLNLLSSGVFMLRLNYYRSFKASYTGFRAAFVI